MTIKTSGLHHVTSIASNPQRNVDFYTEVLGLRLVKRTVNFDDKYTYHLYYGDEVGTPGTVLTFFPFEGARQGHVGRGQTNATAFVIPENSVDYWVNRFESKNIAVESPHTRFDETVIPFRDPDGQPLELVTGTSNTEPWVDGPVPADKAIRGFHSVTLDSLHPDQTSTVLETLGYESTAQDGNRTRYETDGCRASVIDVLDRPDARQAQQGIGTVHHVAFRTPDPQTQEEWREPLSAIGLHLTPQKDRQYFKSVYFREPGGILFEIATEGPGFTRDESVSDLGTELKLPPWLESDRTMLEKRLPEIEPATPIRGD